MLSRSRMIHRSPGESPRPTPRNRGEEKGGADRALRGRVWGKVALLALLVVVSATFLLLNKNAVVEPRLRLPFVNYERPGLVPVLLLTSALSIACMLAFRAVLHARTRRSDARGHSLTATVEREASRIRHAAPLRATVSPASIPQPVSAS